MFSRIVLAFVVLIAAFGLSQSFLFYDSKCANYNPASVTACAVTDLCALTGTDRDTAVTCLREQEAGAFLLRHKIQTCDASGNYVCEDAYHCVDLAVQKCGTCTRTPQLLSLWGCKAMCGYRFGEKLAECL